MELEGVNVHYVSFEGNRIIRILRFLHQCIKIGTQIKPDVLFVVEFNLCQVIALAITAPLKVLDIRTGSLSPNAAKRKLENTYIKTQSLFFDRIIVLSQSLQEKMNLKTKNLIVLPLGAEEFYKGRHTFKSLELLYVGTLRKRNLHQTIEGLGIFLQKRPEYLFNIKYTIIAFGSDKEKSQLFEAITKYKLQNNVLFEGLKNYDELPPFFEKCNVGVAYTPVTDFFNCQPVTKIYEYAISGLYTIATNTLENQRTITDKNGILCNDTPESFAEAIEKVYYNLEHIQESEIRKSLIHHRWNILVKNVLEPFLIK
jgi:glycosyltransferase involved in cell wall biosynthesis